jgi:DNA excision repair protein ERCC-4
MCSSEQSCNNLREFLSQMDPLAAAGSKGRKSMESRLQNYLFWKGKLGNENKSATNPSTNVASAARGDAKSAQPGQSADANISEALKRKDALRKERQGSRRRTRGPPPNMPRNESGHAERSLDPTIRSGALGGETLVKEEADELADL